GLDHEPRLTVLGLQMLIPVRRARARVLLCRAADRGRGFERALPALRAQRGHLRRPEILEPLTRELVGPLERRPVLVLVRVGALDQRIAPRGARRAPGTLLPGLSVPARGHGNG